MLDFRRTGACALMVSIASLLFAAPAFGTDEAEISWDFGKRWFWVEAGSGWGGGSELVAQRGNCAALAQRPSVSVANPSRVGGGGPYRCKRSGNPEAQDWKFDPDPKGDWVRFEEQRRHGEKPGKLFVNDGVRYPTGYGNQIPECVGHRTAVVWCDMTPVARGHHPLQTFVTLDNDTFSFSKKPSCVGRTGLSLVHELRIEHSTVFGSGYNENLWPAGYGDNRINSCGGRDFLEVGGRHNRVDGGAGADELYGRKSSTLKGGGGNDYIKVGNGSTADGGPGNDVLVDTKGESRLVGGPDDDKLYSKKGHDILLGNSGRDRLQSGKDHDRLNCGPDHDRSIAGRNSTVKQCEVRVRR